MLFTRCLRAISAISRLCSRAYCHCWNLLRQCIRTYHLSAAIGTRPGAAYDEPTHQGAATYRHCSSEKREPVDCSHAGAAQGACRVLLERLAGHGKRRKNAKLKGYKFKPGRRWAVLAKLRKYEASTIMYTHPCKPCRLANSGECAKNVRVMEN